MAPVNSVNVLISRKYLTSAIFYFFFKWLLLQLLESIALIYTASRTTPRKGFGFGWDRSPAGEL